jgi:hypothetical protein
LCYPISELDDDIDLNKPRNKDSITNIDGQFVFYLKPGKYGFVCGVDGELEAVGPEEIVVVNKNIKNIVFRLYTVLEIIEANLDILNEIPPSTPTVRYKWGRVPIHSEKECRVVAEEWLSDFKDESEVLIGARIGSPVICYDLKDNPGYYQFPVINMGVEVGYIGVDAMQLDPEMLGHGYIEMTLEEFKTKLETIKGRKATFDRFVPDAIEKVAEKKGLNKDDIEFVKLLCLAANRGGNLYAMLRIIPTNKTVIVNLYSFDILTDRLTLEEIQEDTEDGIIYNYIKQFKKARKIPLM